MAPWKDNHLPEFKSLQKVHDWIKPLLDKERAGEFSD